MRRIADTAENSIEALETRIAPAGVVDITLERGVLTINGDAADNRLQVSAAGNGQILVETDDDTDLGAGPGVAITLAGTVRNVASDMGDGNDHLTITGFRALKRVSLTDGIGDDFAILEDVSVKGAVQASLGAGSDVLNLTGGNVRIGGNVLADGAGGDDTFNFIASRTSILGTLTVSGGGGGDTVATIANRLTLGKNATLDLGNGNNAVRFGDFSDIRAQGNLSITSGSGADILELASDGGILSVRKDLAINVGDGENTITHSLFAPTVAIGGTYRIIGGNDGDFIRVGGSDFTVGNLVINAGDGLNNVGLSSSSTAVRNLTIIGGSNSDAVDFFGPNLTVNGQLRVDAGEGNNSVGLFLQNFLVRGASTINTGSGDDSFEIIGDGRFSGRVLIDLGAGGTPGDPQNINIQGNGTGVIFAGSLTARSSGGVDSVDGLSLQNVETRGATSISLGDGISEVALDDVFLRSSLLLETNDGNDTINFERLAISPFDSLALRGVNIRPGAGDDVVQIGNGLAGTRVDFRGTLSVNDSAGTDTINAVAEANLFPVGRVPEIIGFENISG